MAEYMTASEAAKNWPNTKGRKKPVDGRRKGGVIHGL